MVFDIGSGSVAAAIISAKAGHPSKVLFNKRKTLSHEDRDEKQLLSALQTALSEVGDAVMNGYTKEPSLRSSGAIKDVHVMIHSPWIYSVTRESQVQFDKPTTVNRDIITKAIKEAPDDTHEEVTKFGDIFEKVVMHTELSGYTTAQPIGKESTSIRIVALESRVNSALLNSLINVIAKIAPDKKPTFHSSTYAYHSTLREIAQDTNSYTFLDIGSEASACSIVRNGAIREQSPVKSGTRVLLRAVTKESKTTPSNMYSLISMISEGVCTDMACEEVDKALTVAEPGFMRSFGEVFSSLITENRLPNVLVIAIHPKISKWSREFFSRIDFSQFTETGRPFSVRWLSARALTGLVSFGPLSKQDTPIAVISALVHIQNAE